MGRARGIWLLLVLSRNLLPGNTNQKSHLILATTSDIYIGPRFAESKCSKFVRSGRVKAFNDSLEETEAS